MKFIKLSRDSKYALIGEDINKGQWYTIEENVSKFIKNIEPNSDVSIKSQKRDNTNYLTFIQKTNGAVPVNRISSVEPPEPQVSSVPTTIKDTQSVLPTNVPHEKKVYGNSTEVQESIKRQAIGHMVSRSLICLQGQVSVENIKEITTDLYNHYQKLVR